VTEPPRPRVLYVLFNYPALSETYIQAELAQVARDFDVLVVGCRPSEVLDDDPFPYLVEGDPDAIVEIARDFRPDVLHSHWLDPVPVTAHVARRTGVPFTVRTHGFDVQWTGRRERLFRLPLPTARVAPERARAPAALLRDDLCLGVLCFPWARRTLRKLGVPDAKLRDCFPVVDVARFLDRAPNGEGVMYGGPVLPSKEIGNVLELARMTPERRFDVYGIHDADGRLARQNEALGRPATLHPQRQHRDMPAAYKEHEWYVKVPSLANRGIGWPVSVAEAQASGVGVCMTRFRPDLADYLGGAGFLVESLAEARDVITKAYPSELRELGFEVAQRSDVRRHLHVLTDLWAPAIRTAAG
jgi:hypothetical protein